LNTPSKVTAKRPLFSPKTKRKYEHEPLTPKKIELKKKIKLFKEVRQRDKKINNLKSLLENLRSKGLIEEQCEQLLIDQFEGTS